LHPVERNAIGGVHDVVVYTPYVTNLTSDNAICRGCIANDPLLAVSHNPCTNGRPMTVPGEGELGQFSRPIPVPGVSSGLHVSCGRYFDPGGQSGLGQDV
jgi:hypothetical protein